MKREVALLAGMIARPVAVSRVAVWTWSAHRRFERTVRTAGIAAIDHVPPPPPVGAGDRTTVSAVLRLMGATCLVRSAVLQRWDADRGESRPLVVGVMHTPDGAVAAHAWLDGEESDGFVELHRRLPAP